MDELLGPRDAAIMGLRVVYGLRSAYPRSFPVGADFALGITDLRAKDPETYKRIMTGPGVGFAIDVLRKLLDQGIVSGFMESDGIAEASIDPQMRRDLDEVVRNGKTKAALIDEALLRSRDGRSPANDECIALAREIGFEP